jgi:hypothetical protein
MSTIHLQRRAVEIAMMAEYAVLFAIGDLA